MFMVDDASLLTWLNGDVALRPADRAIDSMFADIEAVRHISKAWLVGYPLLSSTRQRLGRKYSDKLHVFVSVVELVNVLENKHRDHSKVLPT